MSEITIVYSVLGALVALFVWNRLPVELVALGGSLVLVGTGVLDLDQGLAGFADPTVLLIASLFVVSEALDSTGVTTWAGQRLVERAGSDPRRLVMWTMLMVAALTALITPNGSVAALLPMVVVVAVRLDLATSQLLIPLAFGAHAGSLLVLTGSPVNVFISEAAEDAGIRRIGFFEFALAGIPLLVGTIAIVVLLGPRVLPHRRPNTLPPDLSDHARTIGLQYLGDTRVYRVRVAGSSVLAGRPVEEFDPLAGGRCEIVRVERPGPDGAPRTVTGPEVAVDGDVIIVRADRHDVAGFVAEFDLEFDDAPFRLDTATDLVDREIGVAELVVPPRSALIGTAVFPGMVTPSGDLVVLAVQRDGRDLGVRPTGIAAGDVVLVQGPWDRLEHHVDADPDVIAVHEPDTVRRQAVPLGPGSQRTLVIVGAMVAAMATGIVPPVVAGLVAAIALVFSGALPLQRAYHGITWTTVVLVAAMIPMSTAMQQTGAAAQLADRLVAIVGDLGPHALLVGIFVLTAALGQLISNMATVLVVLPVALSAAADLGISPLPVLVSLNVVAAAAVLTPVATPANLMVMGPGDYRFGDYWKLGLPVLAWFFVIAVIWVPIIWRF